MPAFPYDGLFPYQTLRGVRDLPLERACLSPSPFAIEPDDLVATAGSCFAANLGPHLRDAGFTHHITEGEGPFSARYGNLYSPLHLLQLFERAFGMRRPAESAWRTADGFVDPFRARTACFASERALEEDRARHLAAVRALFESLDVLVFTCGLTEIWYSREDGSAFSVCPGNGTGEFSEERYAFGNLGVEQAASALETFLDGLHEINPRARLVLSVSPIPLVATPAERNVVQANSYSKSVLRVACERIRERNARAAYFPAYEIITAPLSAGRYYDADARHVTAEGVRCVVRAFFEQFAPGTAPLESSGGEAAECEDEVLSAAIERDAAARGLA